MLSESFPAKAGVSKLSIKVTEYFHLYNDIEQLEGLGEWMGIFGRNKTTQTIQLIVWVVLMVEKNAYQVMLAKLPPVMLMVPPPAVGEVSFPLKEKVPEAFLAVAS